MTFGEPVEIDVKPVFIVPAPVEPPPDPPSDPDSIALDTLRKRLPARQADMTDQQLLILAQIESARSAEKAETRQRGIENLCKLFGIYDKESDDESQQDRELGKAFKRLVAQSERRVRRSKGVKSGPGGDSRQEGPRPPQGR